MAKKYTASDIDVLEGLEPVRQKPGMYIGGTQGPEGLHHLIKEILDNSIDEAMNGFAKKLSVTLHTDNKAITIEDDGRGIPVDTHPKLKKPALEVILTTLHSGGKFSDKNYVSAGGLHGVGSSVVNALSEKLVATVQRDGFTWEQTFSRGKATSSLKKVQKSDLSGTKIFFKPDPEIFKNPSFDSERVQKIIEEKAYLNKGLKISYLEEANKKSKLFFFPSGINTFLEQLLIENKAESISTEKFYFESNEKIAIELAFAWTSSTKTKILAFVNGIPTSMGGSHEEGFKNGIGKAIRNYINTHNISNKDLKLTGEDLREGLFAIVTVKIPAKFTNIQFQGQTKDKLNNPEIIPLVEKLTRSFENTLNANPSVANIIIERVSLAAKARQAARQASASITRNVGAARRLNLPGKLADCSSRSAEHSELFIVEGDSAGGSAKQGRDRKTQAIFPLKGKIINSFSSASEKIENNKELADLVKVLGCGSGEANNAAKLRYGKVVILTDADSDGCHIATLLLAFFYKYLRSIVKHGRLYLAKPPLYRLRIGQGDKQEQVWVYSDQAKEQYISKLAKNRTMQITRFKGLGEMNPKTLWETTLDPKKRTLIQIKIDNEIDTDKNLESLLGKDAKERFDLIKEHAGKFELDL